MKFGIDILINLEIILMLRWMFALLLIACVPINFLSYMCNLKVNLENHRELLFEIREYLEWISINYLITLHAI